MASINLQMNWSIPVSHIIQVFNDHEKKFYTSHFGSLQGNFWMIVALNRYNESLQLIFIRLSSENYPLCHVNVIGSS